MQDIILQYARYSISTHHTIPSSKLLSRVKRVNLSNLLYSVGIEPVKQFDFKVNTTKSVRSPNILGNVPVSMHKDTGINTSLVVVCS